MTKKYEDAEKVVFEREFFRQAGRKRWRGKSKAERQLQASKAAHARWAKLTPEQRSAEMKRRAKKRESKKGAR